MPQGFQFFRRAKRPLFAGLAVLGAFVVLELLLRLAGAALLWRQHFLTRPHPAAQGAETEYRILCLGESTTARGGADSWPMQMERELNGRKIPGAVFRVFNEGREGTMTSYILSALEDNLARTRPHVVIAMIGLNDDLCYAPASDAVSGGFSRFWDGLRLVRAAKILAERVGERFFPQSSGPAVTESSRPLAASAAVEIFEAARETARAGRAVEAQDFLLSACRSGPQPDEARRACVEWGRELLRNGDYEEASRVFEGLRLIDPKCEEAYAYLIDAYAESKRFDLARKVFEEGVSALPAGASIYFRYYYAVSENRADREEVEKWLLKAIELDASDPNKNVEAGCFYLQDRRYAQAEAMFKRSLDLGSTDSRPYLYLVDIYRSGRRERELEEHVILMQNRFSARFFPPGQVPDSDVDRIYDFLGLYFLERGDSEKAELYFKTGNGLRGSFTNTMTADNYRSIRDLVLVRGAYLVCMQYPLRPVEVLKTMVGVRPGVLFVDNEAVFRRALARGRYEEWFTDHFGGNFGHATPKGNRLIAENAAQTVLRALGLD